MYGHMSLNLQHSGQDRRLAGQAGMASILSIMGHNFSKEYISNCQSIISNMHCCISVRNWQTQSLHDLCAQ